MTLLIPNTVRYAQQMNSFELDAIDREILVSLMDHPRIGVQTMANHLGVARGTVQTRLTRLRDSGVIRSFPPEIDLVKIGYSVLAFTTIEISQGRFRHVVETLKTIPELLEAHATAGEGDLLCRVVAASHDDLMRVIEFILGIDGVARTHSAIALAEEISFSTRKLVVQAE